MKGFEQFRHSPKVVGWAREKTESKARSGIHTRMGGERMRRNLVMIFSLILAMGSCSVSAGELNWVSGSAPGGGREVTAIMKTQLLGGETQLQIRFFASGPDRTPDEHGTIGIELGLSGPDRLSGFHFDEFEGPDAAGGRLEATVKGPFDAVSEVFRPSGFYLDNSFVFSISTTERKYSTVKRVLQAIVDGGNILDVKIPDPKDPSKELHMEIPTSGCQKDVAALLNLFR